MRKREGANERKKDRLILNKKLCIRDRESEQEKESRHIHEMIEIVIEKKKKKERSIESRKGKE